MSSTGDGSLSLESLFAFVDGLSDGGGEVEQSAVETRSGEPQGISAEEGAETPALAQAYPNTLVEEPAPQPLVSKEALVEQVFELPQEPSWPVVVPTSAAAEVAASVPVAEVPAAGYGEQPVWHEESVAPVEPVMAEPAPASAVSAGAPSGASSAAPSANLADLVEWPALAVSPPEEVLARLVETVDLVEPAEPVESARAMQAEQPAVDFGGVTQEPVAVPAASSPESTQPIVLPEAAGVAPVAETTAAAPTTVENPSAQVVPAQAKESPCAGVVVPAKSSGVPAHAAVRGKHAVEPELVERSLAAPAQILFPDGRRSLEELRASVESRLDEITRQRLEEGLDGTAAAPGALAATPASPTPASTAPQSGAAFDGALSVESLGAALGVDLKDGATAPASAATPENAAAPSPDAEAQPRGSSEITQPTPEEGEAGAPADAESSALFDEPPASIKESMREAETLHRRGFKLKVAAGCVLGALALAGTVFVVSQSSWLFDMLSSGPGVSANTEQNSGDDNQTSHETETPDGDPVNKEVPVTKDDSTTDKDTSGNKGNSSSNPQGSSTSDDKRDLSGTVVYRYTTTSAADEQRTTTETVTFGRDGLCETSSLEVGFPDAAAAETFFADMQRDFGAAYREGAVDGSTVRATLDVSANKLDRESYEDQLRISVDDLVIVKKS